jgi:hypothetical protein
MSLPLCFLAKTQPFLFLSLFVKDCKLKSGAWIAPEGKAFRGLKAERTLVREYFNLRNNAAIGR